jgi:WD40 repeat protein
MEDNTYTLWDTESVQPLRKFVGHTGRPEGVSFHSDGRRFASCGFDKTVRIWDVETGQELHCLNGHTSNVNLIAYSPDGMRLASTGSEGTVIVWDAERGRKLFGLSTTGTAFGVAFSPNGERLFTSQESGSVDLWDVTPCGPGEMGAVRLDQSIFWIEGSRDGSRLVIWNTDGTFTARDGYTLQPIDSLNISPQLPTQDAALAISPDETQLAVGNDGHLVIWDMKSGQKTLERTVEDGWIVGRGGRLAFSPDGKHLAASSDPETVSIWDLTSGQRDWVLPVSLKEISMILYSRDNRFLIVCGNAGIVGRRCGDIYVWDLQHPEVSPKILHGDIPGVWNLDISPDSQRVAACGFGSSPEVWDILRGERLLVLQGHATVVRTIYFSPDGRYLVTASQDGTARVWDANSGAELLCYRVPGQDVAVIAGFTPDGRRVAMLGDDGCYRLLAFLDFDELLEIVRKRATRDWKPEERRRNLR